MNASESPDEDDIAAMMWDDVIDMLNERNVSQKRLIEFEEKWLKAGASLHACKLARLFASSAGAYQAGQDDTIGRMATEFTSAVKMLRDAPSDPSDHVATKALPRLGDARAGHALIMKGGGIKGLAYVGAIEHLTRCYNFDWYVGTSAGAVAAVLLGAGYNADELRQILRDKDFRDFFDAAHWKKWANLAIHHGFYPANTFTEWLDKLLAEKLRKPSRVMLSDLPHRVTVYASQRNRQALKFDSRDRDVAAAYAVRCSMSIPFIFIPQSDQGLRAYDGGLQHNYPVNDLLANNPGTPFISLYLGSEIYEPVRQRWVLLDLLSICTESADAEAITRYRDRTVIIDPRPIDTLDFALTDTEKEYLVACGRAGALAHLSNGADECLEAQRIRDNLKADVEEARRIKRARRRVWRYLTLAAFFLLMAVLSWCFWLSTSHPE
ncbi:patatin-like phospholipase family protein [Tautonia rosea]|uniref:patatin-like phospholipase family protein n=1 Tax=Tautonia rosea TaxID=2728037 RepID=UPI001474E61A|nr:patatin-like phospholipase family protein [Tautonia rosea]